MKILAAGSAVYGLRSAIAALGKAEAIEIATDHGHDIHHAVVAGKCDADIVIIPADMLEDLDRRDLLTGPRRRIGFTGIGYCVPRGATLPVIADEPTLRSAVEAAQGVYLTTAPTGQHMQGCLLDLGFGQGLTDKLRLFERATEMLRALGQCPEGSLAFGPTTELMAWRDKGVDYGGGVPFAFDLPLAYDAAVLARGADRRGAADLLDDLAGPEGLAHFRASGVS